MPIDDLSRKVGLDTTDFKKGISDMNREMRLLESGFKANASALGDWANDASGLELRIETLTGKIEVQQKKLAAYRAEYDRLAGSGKASQQALDNLQVTINNETETLNKMQTELGQTQTSLANLGKEEDKTAKKTVSLKDVMGALGQGLKVALGAVLAVAGAVAGLGAGIAKLVLDTAKASDELVEMSDKTGLSTERLQELRYIGEQTGTDLDTITSSLAKLTRSMDAARDGTGDSGEAFARLGIQVTDANGNLRNSEDVFNEAITRLGEMADGTERDALAMELFGKSAMELNPLIKAGAAGMAKMSEEARKNGAVMSGEAVEGFADLNDALAGLKMGLQGTLGTLAGAFLPGLKGVMGQAQGYMQTFASIVSSSGGDLGKMAEGVGALVGTIAQDIAAQAPKLLQSGLDILKGILNAILTNLPIILPVVIEMITSLLNFIVEMVPMLLEAGLQIVITLINGIAQALPKLIEMVATILPKLIITLIEALPLLIDAALKLVLALIDGLVVALPILIEYIPQILWAIVNAILASLPIIGEAAVKIVMALLTGIVGALPSLGAMIPQLLDVIVQGIAGIVVQLGLVGADIVKGIWAGIQNMAGWFSEQVKGFFANIISEAKKALGIKSPSTVFGDMGENMALGLGKGFENAFRGIENDINNSIAGMGGDVSLGGGGGSVVNHNANLGGITINVYGGGDPAQIARATEMGVRRAMRATGAA